MFGWRYTVQITEKRRNGAVAWCYDQKASTLKKAYKIILKALQDMKNVPHSIIIYKDWAFTKDGWGRSVPKVVFEWGDDASFNIVDMYL